MGLRCVGSAIAAFLLVTTCVGAEQGEPPAVQRSLRGVNVTAASQGSSASQGYFSGRLIWKGASTCMQLGRLDHYNLYLKTCNGDDLWASDDCGHIVNQVFQNVWSEYWDGPASGDFYDHENGQIYSLPYPGRPVPCDRGLKLSLEPFPVVDMTNFPDPNSGGCFSTPSEPFQIKSGSNCVTVKDKIVNTGNGNSYVYHMAVLAPCMPDLISQQFTYEYRGCD